MNGLINKAYSGDFQTWWLDYGQDRLFRLFVYKRMFTPYEQEQKFIDENKYEDTYCKFVYIREVIELSNGDYLLGVQETFDGEMFDSLEYYHLSEIRLSYRPADVENEDSE